MEAQCGPKKRKSFELHFPKNPPIAAPSLLRHFTALGSPHLTSYILPPLDTLPPHSYTNLSPPPGSRTLTSFYPLWTNYPLTLTPFYPPWQPNSYIILPPLDKLPPLTQFYYPWQPKSYIILPPLDKLPPDSYTIWPPLAAQLVHHFTPSGHLPKNLNTWKGPPIAANCSPLLHGNFSQWVISWKVLPLQPIAAHCSPHLHGNFSQGGNSWKVLSLQPTFTWQFQSEGVIPEKSSHCSPLQPTLTWQFQSGGNSWKVLPLQPNSYIIYSLSEQITPTLLHQFTPNRQITPRPHSYNKMGGY